MLYLFNLKNEDQNEINLTFSPFFQQTDKYFTSIAYYVLITKCKNWNKDSNKCKIPTLKDTSTTDVKIVKVESCKKDRNLRLSGLIDYENVFTNSIYDFLELLNIMNILIH